MFPYRTCIMPHPHVKCLVIKMKEMKIEVCHELSCNTGQLYHFIKSEVVPQKTGLKTKKK